MVDPVSPNEPTTAIEAVTLHPTKQMSLEKARLHDVLLLLESMFEREETTVKLVLGLLYDIGSVNLIDQKLRSRSLNRLAKWIAKFSKPVFRMIALRWFKRNCPRMIRDWLYTQVKFEPRQLVHAVQVAEAAALPAASVSKSASESAPELEVYRQEVRMLHSRIKLLTTLLISVTCALGSGLLWMVWREQSQAYQPAQVTPIEFVERSHCIRLSAQPCH